MIGLLLVLCLVVGDNDDDDDDKSLVRILGRLLLLLCKVVEVRGGFGSTQADVRAALPQDDATSNRDRVVATILRYVDRMNDC